MKVSLDKITVDERLQHREHLNDEMILELKDAYKEGKDVAPVLLIFDGETHWMPDGHHRYYGCKSAGLTEIEANVYDGDYRAAWLYSLGANAAHGIRRTHGDLRRIVQRALADPALAAEADGKIAAAINCARSTVQLYRTESRDKAETKQPEVAAKPDKSEGEKTGGDHGVSQPPVVTKSINEDKKQALLRRKVQRVYGQLANLVEEMGLWDVLAATMADLKHHTGIV